MGGLAIKDEYIRRYSKDEYLKIKEEVLGILSPYFKKIDVPYSYNNKETFGDLDIVASNDDYSILDMGSIIRNEFSPNEVCHNNDCWSFDHKEFQIDLIFTPEEHFYSKFVYMCYNDLGNLMGVIAKGFGVKYGDMGLTKDVWYEGQKICKNLLISKDYEKIFDFLGLSFDEWKEGFDDIEDIFEFVYSSPYFDKEGYQFRNLNKINRDRNEKRSVYMYFLEWLKNKPDKSFEFYEDKRRYLKKIDDHFPESDFMERLRGIEFEHAKKLYISSKLNVKEILTRLDLPIDNKHGKEIAIVFDQYKRDLGSTKNFEEHVINNDKSDIIDNEILPRVKEHFKEIGFPELKID